LVSIEKKRLMFVVVALCKCGKGLPLKTINNKAFPYLHSVIINMPYACGLRF
jgi:hypothetical protein